MKKTTVKLPEKHQELLKELEDTWGMNQTEAIRLGIVMAYREYIGDRRDKDSRDKVDTVNMRG